MGRKRIIKSKKTLGRLIDEYFDSLKGGLLRGDDGEPVFDKRGSLVIMPDKPPTVAGLARACGFQSKQTLYNYRRDDRYAGLIDDALLRIEEYTESRLFDRDGARGAEFSLKNNFKWEQREAATDNDGRGVVVLSEIKEVNDDE